MEKIEKFYEEMMASDAALESKVRRLAKQLGYGVEKSRTRNRHINDRGLYQMTDGYNTVVAGVNYDATPEELLGFLIQKLEEGVRRV
jgi:hypothetical protein